MWAFPTVLNQDGTVNSQSSPALLNSVVTFYATGSQSNFAPLADGQVAAAAQNLCTRAGVCEVSPSNNVLTGTVLYAGAAPGIVAGVTQFNVEISTAAINISGTPEQFSFTVTGPASASQTVWVEF